MAARYDDNEFVIYINNSTDKSLKGTANKLLSLIETSPVLWDNDAIYISLSLITVNHEIDDEVKVNPLLKFADEAMHHSKEKGNNKVFSYRFSPALLPKKVA